jgi:hypothetical protein
MNCASPILGVRMSTYILLGGGLAMALLIAIVGIWRLK